MSAGPQPWWASAAGVEHLDEVDPVEAFRAARRPGGPRPGDGPATREPPDGLGPAPTDPAGEHTGPGTGDADRDRERTDPGRGDAAAGQHRPELCGICPLCTLARNLEQTRPELLEHLTEAVRHLSAAARVLMEQPPPARGPQGPADGPAARGREGRTGSGVHRIRLDQDPGPRPPGASTDTSQEQERGRG